MGPKVLVEFVTKDNCPLCAETLASLRPIASRQHVEVTVVELGDRPDLEQFRERVPVLLDDGGKVLAEGRIGRRALRRSVRRARRAAGGRA